MIVGCLHALASGRRLARVVIPGPTGSEMETIFDIFRRLPDGKPLWIESVQGLRAATARLEYLAAATPGDYFLYSEKSGGMVDIGETIQQKHRAA